MSTSWHTRILPILGVLLMCAATDVGAQERDRPTPPLESGLSSGTVERLRAIWRRAERGGVPPELLRRKVSEGVSKGVAGERLERAIEDYAERLLVARRLAGADASPDLLTAAAEAAESGVPAQRIRSFLSANPNPVRGVVGLRVVAELYELGVPPGEAARGVNAALDRGLRGERLLAVSAVVRRRVATGDDPTEALRAEVDIQRAPVESRRAPDRRRSD